MAKAVEHAKWDLQTALTRLSPGEPDHRIADQATVRTRIKPMKRTRS